MACRIISTAITGLPRRLHRFPRLADEPQERPVIARAEQHEAARPGHGLEPSPDRLWVPTRKPLVGTRVEAPQLTLERRAECVEWLVHRQANVFDADLAHGRSPGLQASGRLLLSITPR